jgi:hypothetical protein
MRPDLRGIDRVTRAWKGACLTARFDDLPRHHGNSWEATAMSEGDLLDLGKLVVDQNLVCPSCGFEYVHPTLVEVNAGGSITTIDKDGTRMSGGVGLGRGVNIRLGFACEDGCRTSISIQFHKGNTHITAYKDETVPKDTIWRD